MKIREIQKKYGFNFKSSLGQNFFNNDNLLESMIEKLEINKDDLILEIGPGFGVLTEKLLKRAYKVFCVEVDKSAVYILNEEFRDYKNLKIINEDFLKIDLRNIEGLNRNFKVVANIPYYITTPILEKLFKSNLNMDFIAIMVQKEVGDRILASPSTKDYGSLTLFSNYYSKVSIIEKIPAHNFTPMPKVDSVFLKCEVLKDRFFKNSEHEEEFLKFIKRCFTMRRKNLFNVLGQFNFGKETLSKASSDLNIDFNLRIENLNLFDVQNIFNYLSKLN